MGTGRTFDFEIDLKNNTQVIFNNVPRDEYGPLFDFLNAKKLNIKNNKKSGKGSMMDDLVDSDEDDRDHYLQQVKNEGREAAGSDDDDEDEDFDPTKDKNFGKEIAEDYDSDPDLSSDGTSDSDLSEDEKERRREKKRKKAQQRDSREQRAKKKEARKERGEAGSSRTKSKKKKDPNAPKKPMSAYFLFMNEKRESIKRDNPDAGVSEIGKIAGEMWNKLEDKSRWEQMQKEAKEKYDIEYAEYLKTKPASEDDSADERPAKKKKKDPNAPKKPMTAYFLFMNEKRESIKRDNPDAGVSDIGKIAAEMWSKIDDKSEWEAKYEKAKEKYAVDYAEYMKNKPPSDDEGTSSKKKSTNKKSSTARKSDSKSSNPNVKSAEFIDSDSSSDEDGSKPAPAKKSKKDEAKEESEDDGDFEKEDEDMDEDEDEKPEERITSRRGKTTEAATKLEELPEDGAESSEAEMSEGGSSTSSSDSGDDDD